MNYDVECGLISKLVETSDMKLIKDKRINREFFSGEAYKVFSFIEDHYIKYAAVPTDRIILAKFPAFVFEKHDVEGKPVIGTSETLAFWIDEVRRKKKHNTLASVTEEVAKSLAKGESHTAYAAAQQGLLRIETEIEENTAIDITADNIDERKKEYLKRKETKGIIGIPTGISYLDSMLRGLQPEQLITMIARTGIGKALTLDTPVLTSTGFVPMRDIKVGTEVCAKNGEFYPVTNVYPQGRKQVYRVSFEDGAFVDCCKDHLWEFKTQDDVRRKNAWKVKTTEQMLNDYPLKRNRAYNLCIPVNDAVQFNSTETLPIHPYVLGSLLGDGGFTTDRISFTSEDTETVMYLNSLLVNWGKFISTSDKNYQYTFKGISHKENKLYRAVKELGLIGMSSETKFIPRQYLYASYADRLMLVRGLIDTDGTVNPKGHIQYYTGNKQLCDSFAFLVRSLGYRCRVRKYQRNEKNLPEYVVYISARTPILFTSEKRRKQWDNATKPKRVNYYGILKIVNIEVLDKYEDMQCISVDSPDHTFICGDFIVTHNTWFQVLVGANAHLQNYRVLHLITEMSETAMRDRYEAMLMGLYGSRLSYSRFKSGTLTPDEETDYFNFLDSMGGLDSLVLDVVSGVSDVVAGIEVHKPDLVLIDGAYLMEDERGAKEDWLRIAHITRDLKLVAKRTHLPIFINSQADSTTSKKTGPELDNIAYARAVGQDSDVVLALFQDNEMRNDREMKVKVLKQREGVLGSVMLSWDFTTMNFTPLYSREEVVEDSSTAYEATKGVVEI